MSRRIGQSDNRRQSGTESGRCVRCGPRTDSERKVKAARCGSVGYLKNMGKSAHYDEVHFCDLGCNFPQVPGKIEALCTSRAEPACVPPRDSF